MSGPVRLPRRGRALGDLFRKATTPSPSDFAGEYHVDMLTRVPSLGRLSHRKVFRNEGSEVVGHNSLLSGMVWGRFRLARGVCEAMGSIGVVVIDYDVPGNSILTRGIRDHVRCVEEGSLYIGRFNYRILRELRFCGYFSLSRGS